jgi:hypothetical protein
MGALPPPLSQLLAAPVLRSELPAGINGAFVFPRAAAPRYHILGGAELEFTGPSGTAFVSYELFRTGAEAQAFARRHACRSGRVQAGSLRRFAVVATGATRARAVALLKAAVAHLRRVER